MSFIEASSTQINQESNHGQVSRLLVSVLRQGPAAGVGRSNPPRYRSNSVASSRLASAKLSLTANVSMQ
jgi:hypothetical protein